jgi:hypothetical protein
VNLFGVLFTVLVVVLLAGLGLLVWGLVEGWRERARAWRHRQYCEQRRIEREAQAVAGRLRQQAFRVQGEMMRHVVQRMDPPKRQRPGGRHG